MKSQLRNLTGNLLRSYLPRFAVRSTSSTIQSGVLTIDFICTESLEALLLLCPRNREARLGNFLAIKATASPIELLQVNQVCVRIRGEPYGPALPVNDIVGNLPDYIEDDWRRVLASFQDSSDFLILTHHLSHRCVMMNDRAEPGRLIWQPGQYLADYNFLDAWRDSMQSLKNLTRELNQTGRCDNFTYRLRRTDGSLGEYTKSYELVHFLGAPMRLSKSHEWHLLELADGTPVTS